MALYDVSDDSSNLPVRQDLTAVDLWVTWGAERGTSGSLGYWLGLYALWGLLETTGMALACLYVIPSFTVMATTLTF